MQQVVSGKLKVLFILLTLLSLGVACGDNNSDDDGSGNGQFETCESDGDCEGASTCINSQCIAACENPEQTCGEKRELCCADGEACLFNTCATLGAACSSDNAGTACNIDEFCETSLGRCVSDDVRPDDLQCFFMPEVGQLEPGVECEWGPSGITKSPAKIDVVMTPVVMNLTDDNGDGITDRNDIPDLVFTSFNSESDGCCTPRGLLRIVSGKCGDDGVMITLATLGDNDPQDAPRIDNSAGVALGNLHAYTDPDSATPAQLEDNVPEIITVSDTSAGTIDNEWTVTAFKRVKDDGTEWEVMWSNDSAITRARHSGGSRASAGAPQPSIADLDGDGRPEVIIGNVALDGLDGSLIWDGFAKNSKNVGEIGVGNNAFLGPVSVVADIDLAGGADKHPEVIAGNTVYDHEGNEMWTYEYNDDPKSVCDGFDEGGIPCDGYTAVGNFDDDDEGEVVIVRRGEVFVLNHDGSLLSPPGKPVYQVELPNSSCANGNESGPPTIADFDGDGEPEIGTAGASSYVVVDFECFGDDKPAGCQSDMPYVRWEVENKDCTSRSTGSSVFDFEGDGRAEVVYADEVTFRILKGTDGSELYRDDSHVSNTRLEMPIVVDIDNDAKSEVIIPSAAHRGNSSSRGIKVWSAAGNDWVRTRRVWNQHSYHVSNVSEDGEVYAYEEPNWLQSGLNNFRQNVQPDGLFEAPDLVVRGVDINSGGSSKCLVFGGPTQIEVTIANEGLLGVAEGVPVLLEVKRDDGEVIGEVVVQSTQRLLPLASEVISLVFDWPDSVPIGQVQGRTFTLSGRVDLDDDGGSTYNECNEENNVAALPDIELCGIVN